jgi:hypothetical protein
VLFSILRHGCVLFSNGGGRPMTVGSGRLPSMKPDAKSLGIPDLHTVSLVSETRLCVDSANHSMAHIQLACQRANGDIFPPNRSTIGRSELGDVFIDGIVEVKITGCVLI